MEERKRFQFQHCFFAVRCLDMWGGDVDRIKGVKSQDEAKEAVKAKLKENSNYCAMIKKEDNATFTVYIKYKTKINPSKNQLRWHNCTSIFFGKKILQHSFNNCQEKMNQLTSKLDYFLVEGLDMQQRKANSFQEGLVILKDLIKYETALCGMIADRRVQKRSWEIFVKDPRRCNPSYSSHNHPTRTTMFVGYQI